MFADLREKYLYFLMFIISIMIWLVGATLGLSSPLTSKLKNHTYDYPFKEDITDDEISWIGSVPLLGGIAGGFVYGKLPDLLGRRNTILLLAVPHIIAHALITWGNEIYLYILSRTVVGVQLGGFYATISMFIGEVSPKKTRGLFGSLIMTFTNLGQLFSLSVAPYTSIMAFNFTLFILTVIYIPVLYLIVPESPYYLILNGKDNMALAQLEKLRGCSNGAIKEELEDIRVNVKKGEDGSFFDIARSRVARRACILMVGFFLLDLGTGLSIVLIYSEMFFDQAGTKIPSELCAIIIGVVQVIVTSLASVTCDRFGRKIMLLVSALGSGIFMTILGVYFYLKDNNYYDIDNIRWLPLVSLIMCVIFHGIGIGPLPMVLMSEMFPMKVKCAGGALISNVICIEGFLLAKYYSLAADTFGMASVLWFFSFMTILCFIFTHVFLIETKGKTMNEIESELENWRPKLL